MSKFYLEDDDQGNVQELLIPPERKGGSTQVHKIHDQSEIYKIAPVGETESATLKLCTAVSFPLTFMCYPCSFSQIPEGSIGLFKFQGIPEICGPGLTFQPSFFRKHVQTVPLTQEVIQHGTITIVTVNEGEIGLYWDNGVAKLLEPGRYWWNSALCRWGQKLPLNQQVVYLGPIKIVTVNQGQVAITYDRGELVVLPPGRHVLSHALHVFSNLMSTRQEVHRLEANKLNTSDNVEITVKVAIFYKVVDAAKVVTYVNDLSKALNERAQVTIAGLILSCPLSSIAPPPPGSRVGEPSGSIPLQPMGDDTETSVFGSKVHDLCMADLAQYFSDLGVNLIDVKLESVVINDSALRSALAERAVATTQTATLSQTAAGNARVTKINAQAEAEAVQIKAEAQARSIRILAQARSEAAASLTNETARKLALIDATKDALGATSTSTIIVPGSFTEMANNLTAARNAKLLTGNDN